MSGFGVVCRHEWRRIRRDRAMLTLVLMFFSISLYAAWNGNAWQSERNVAIKRIQAEEQKYREERRSEKSQGERNVGQAVASVWYQPTLPISPSAAISIGQAEGYPFDAKFHVMTPAYGIFGAMGGHLENPETNGGKFDLAFVIVFLLPLFLLAGNYDLWTRERDIGTAAFLLSHPVSMGVVCAAKALVRGGSLLLCLMVAVLLSLLVTNGGELEAGTLAALCVAIVLYGAFWIVLALGVNVWTRRSTEAAVACGAGWLVVVVLLPAMLAAGADLVRPAPSHAQRINELRLMELKFTEQREAMPELQTEAWRRDKQSYARAEIRELERTEQAYASVVQRFESAHASRRHLGNILRYLSPAVITQDVLDRLAGTDADRALAFQAQVRDFLGQLRRLAFPYLAGERSGESPSGPAILPEFVFREPAAGVTWPPLLRDLVALLALSLIPVLWIRQRVEGGGSD